MFLITQKVRKVLIAVLTSFFCVSGLSNAVSCVQYSKPSPWFNFSMSTWWNGLSAQKKIAIGAVTVATVGVAGYWMYNKFYNKGMSLSEWAARCSALPFNRKILGSKVPVVLQWQEFLEVKNAFCALSFKQLNNQDEWFQGVKLSNDFLTQLDEPGDVAPFVQHLVVPDNAHIYFHGDLHGDIHSLIAYLNYLYTHGVIDNNFKIIDSKKHYLCFLGDYTDRGNYGIEVVYTIMRLKLANPDNVILVRGNHEDCMITTCHGFSEELQSKYPTYKNAHNLITKIYDFLPAAVWIGTQKDVLQCCHGGMETGHDPKPFLNSGKKYELFSTKDDALMQKICRDNNKLYCKDVQSDRQSIKYYNQVGYAWADFQVSATEKTEYVERRGYCFSKKATCILLAYHSKENVKVRGVFRAHQHQGDMMKSILNQGKKYGYKGISLLWKQLALLSTSYKHGEPMPLAEHIVATFNVSPDSKYGRDSNFTYDTFGCLALAQEYKDWRLAIINQEIGPKK